MRRRKPDPVAYVMPYPPGDCSEIFPVESRLHPDLACNILRTLEDLRGEELERYEAARAPHEAEHQAWLAWRDATRPWPPTQESP